VSRIGPPKDSLFAPEPGLARRDHRRTAKEAADQIAGVSGTLRRKVWDYLLERWAEGATDEEMQDAMDMPASTQRPRRCELVEAGEVVDSGTTRKTRSGRSAVVWQLKGAKQ
jgi:hypothetical protein